MTEKQSWTLRDLATAWESTMFQNQYVENAEREAVDTGAARQWSIVWTLTYDHEQPRKVCVAIVRMRGS